MSETTLIRIAIGRLMCMGNPIRPQAYTKNDRKLKNAESGRNDIPQERTYLLVVQNQMISLENIYPSKIIQMEQNVFLYRHMHASIINKKTMNLTEGMEG